MEYKQTRKKDFNRIALACTENTAYQSDNAILLEGDSTELLKSIPDNSVSLILTDPPYHSTKKKNIKNDTAFDTDENFLEWIKELSIEWRRILKPNGSIFFFCSSKMEARLELLFSSDFNVLAHIVWNKPNDPGFEGWKQKMKKESLRQWYGHSERIIFAEPAFEGNLFRIWFANFLKEQRLKCELSMKDLTEITGDYGNVNHGGATSNWESGRNIPSREQYLKICNGLIATGKIDYMPPYEDVIRPFDVNADVEFTDVWNFYSVRPYNGKHPAEKPLDMLEHCILSSSYEGDIVLDCFAGSGSTAIAALSNNRKSISIELDEIWVDAIKNRLKKFEKENNYENIANKQVIMKMTKSNVKATETVQNKQQVSLFC